MLKYVVAFAFICDWFDLFKNVSFIIILHINPHSGSTAARAQVQRLLIWMNVLSAGSGLNLFRLPKLFLSLSQIQLNNLPQAVRYSHFRYLLKQVRLLAIEVPHLYLTGTRQKFIRVLYLRKPQLTQRHILHKCEEAYFHPNAHQIILVEYFSHQLVFT